MYDNNSILQTAANTAAGTINGPGLNLGTGTPVRGLKARVILTGVQGTSTPVVTCTVQDSSDNTTFADLAVGPQFAPGTSVVANTQTEFDIPFNTLKAYVRLKTVVSPAGATATVSADVGIARSQS